jgi:hypothetical protein
LQKNVPFMPGTIKLLQYTVKHIDTGQWVSLSLIKRTRLPGMWKKPATDVLKGHGFEPCR